MQVSQVCRVCRCLRDGSESRKPLYALLQLDFANLMVSVAQG
jgi:hypothetical protein